MTRELVDGLCKRLEELRLIEMKNKERLEYLQTLEKRATPMKVDLSTSKLLVVECPKCQLNNIWADENFCSHCGQAIDWSDVK